MSLKHKGWKALATSRDQQRRRTPAWSRHLNNLTVHVMDQKAGKHGPLYRGDDGHNGAVQCSLTAWSFYLHISIWEDTFDGDFVQDLRFMKKGIKSPMNLFQPRLVQRSEGITFILTSEEEQYRKDERRRKVTIQKKKITVYLSVIARKEFTTSITVYSLNYLITL